MKATYGGINKKLAKILINYNISIDCMKVIRFMIPQELLIDL